MCDELEGCRRRYREEVVGSNPNVVREIEQKRLPNAWSRF